MSDAPLGRKLTKDLDPKAIDEVWDRLEARRRGRPSFGRSIALAGAFAIVVALVVLLSRPAAHAPTALRLEGGAALPEAIALTQPFALSDGSRVGIAEGTLVPLANDGTRVRFALPRGRATFDVVPGGPRTWTIDAGLLTVTVLGTRFDVTRGEHDARVVVERGKVLVTGKRVPGGEVVLTAGEHVEVDDGTVELPSAPLAPDSSAAVPAVTPASPSSVAPVVPSSVAPVVRAPSAAAPSPSSAPSPSVAPTAEAPWHPLAQRGQYSEAYAALGKEGVAREARRAERPEELLQVADVARLSGHPADAVLPLERLLENHPTSRAAPQAAFTLGKIELDALGRPGRAAAAFEKAILLGVPAALKEDAFARRVEAYAKAGEPSKARTARNAYESAFPNGRYAESVQRLAP